MAAWVTIYCRVAVGHVDPQELRAGIMDADFWSLAERYAVDDDAVAPALNALRIDPISGSDGCDFRLVYRDEARRQLDVHFWRSPARVKEELEEVSELIASEGPARRAVLAAALSGVKSVVAVELGFSQLRDMGIVFAFELARWIAARFDGLIKDDDGAWTKVEGGAFEQI